jgi:23S rRNA (cytidine1920-2'-O)/16S rRNA (cytidine1409-2'-O)-methyltransferase
VKPSAPVDDSATLLIDDAPTFVSRGGEKLAGALDDLVVDVTGMRALDLGASTGGFTDCLLQRGVASVVAVDVGYGQLAWSLRNDPRVTVLERTNARYLTPDIVGEPVDLITCDLAFISVATVWPAVVGCARPGHDAVVLVKPQFEVGKGQVGSGGVVRDAALHRHAIERVVTALTDAGGHVRAIARSRLLGPKGNVEFFVHSTGRGEPSAPADLERQIASAVGEAA